MIKALPPDPANLATKDDLAVLGSELRAEMAELRTELRTGLAEVRVEMAGMRVEMREMTSQQTRSLALGLVVSITLLAITQLVVAAIGG